MSPPPPTHTSNRSSGPDCSSSSSATDPPPARHHARVVVGVDRTDAAPRDQLPEQLLAFLAVAVEQGHSRRRGSGGGELAGRGVLGHCRSSPGHRAAAPAPAPARGRRTRRNAHPARPFLLGSDEVTASQAPSPRRAHVCSRPSGTLAPRWPRRAPATSAPACGARNCRSAPRRRDVVHGPITGSPVTMLPHLVSPASHRLMQAAARFAQSGPCGGAGRGHELLRCPGRGSRPPGAGAAGLRFVPTAGRVRAGRAPQVERG